MIQTTPRRSVTRFFIPLIDVLILLFCIFLLLPIVSKSDSDKQDKEPDTGLPADKAKLQDMVRMLEAELKSKIDQLNAAKQQAAENTVVRLLQIDEKDGKLFYLDNSGGKPVPVKLGVDPQTAQTEVQEYINSQRQTAKGKDVHFLILYANTDDFPTQPQVNDYNRWFKERKATYTIIDPRSRK